MIMRGIVNFLKDCYLRRRLEGVGEMPILCCFTKNRRRTIQFRKRNMNSLSPISCRVARNGHKRQTPHPPLSRSPFPSRGRLTESATLNLKQTARRSSYLTFGRFVFAHNIPTTRLKARSWMRISRA